MGTCEEEARRIDDSHRTALATSHTSTEAQTRLRHENTQFFVICANCLRCVDTLASRAGVTPKRTRCQQAKPRQTNTLTSTLLRRGVIHRCRPAYLRL